MTVEELAANLDVTPQTIRRDVQELSETGQLKRYHGGASLGDVSVVTSGQERRNHQQQEKNAIAQLIASTIPDNASLFISIGHHHGSPSPPSWSDSVKNLRLSPTISTPPPSLRRVPTTRSSSLRRGPPLGWRYYRRGNRRFHQPIQSRLCHHEYPRYRKTTARFWMTITRKSASCRRW